MLDLLIGSLSEIKSYVVVLSFFIKIMKQRTFQACSLKHSTKKGMFYVQSKLNFFKTGKGGSPPPCAILENYYYSNVPFWINNNTPQSSNKSTSLSYHFEFPSLMSASSKSDSSDGNWLFYRNVKIRVHASQPFSFCYFFNYFGCNIVSLIT